MGSKTDEVNGEQGLDEKKTTVALLEEEERST